MYRARTVRLRIKAVAFGFLLAASVALLAFMDPAWAATFTVNKTADTNDGTCDATDCSLREAISAANAAAGRDTNARGRSPRTEEQTTTEEAP